MRLPLIGPLIAAAALLSTLFATPALAQENSVDLDAVTAAAAYGDLSVFILNVAAGNDGVPQKPEGEAAFKQLFGEPVADAFSSLSPDDRQALVALGTFDAQLHQAWSSLPDDERTALRDQWAGEVQQMVSNAPCELFDAMARAQLLPSFGQYKQTNINRLLQCWHDQPELTRDSQERASAVGYANGGAAAPSAAGDHGTFMAMLNANMYRYTASMNIASMGTATYTVKSFP
jgi:hypothetical protein